MFVALYAVVIVLNTLVPNIFDALLLPIAKPLWKSESRVIGLIRAIPVFFLTKRHLNDALIIAEEKLALYETTEKNISLLRAENDALRELLGRTPIPKGVVASVLRTPAFSPYDSLIIDAGTKVGVKAGDLVLVGETPAGVVAESFASSAKVKLYSTSGERTPILLSASSTHMEALGRGGGNFEIAAPRDLPVEKGDIVTLPELHTAVFGVVEDVLFDPARAFQTILFRSPFNISEVRTVLIVSNP